MRYLYDKDMTTYEVLLAAMKVAELEWHESRGQYRVKEAVVSSNKEIEDLKERMDKLQAMVKSASAKPENDKKKTPKTSPCKGGPEEVDKRTTAFGHGPLQIQPETHAMS